jgi:hypothetical protein
LLGLLFCEITNEGREKGMSENVSVNEKVCNKEHERIDGILKHHENWLGEHETKIDGLSKESTKNSSDINNLCKQMSGLTKSIWGLVIMVATALLGFFIYAVEKGIFK